MVVFPLKINKIYCFRLLQKYVEKLKSLKCAFILCYESFIDSKLELTSSSEAAHTIIIV